MKLQLMWFAGMAALGLVMRILSESAFMQGMGFALMYFSLGSLVTYVLWVMPRQKSSGEKKFPEDAE